MKVTKQEETQLQICSNCGSDQVRFDPEFGFYKCESCNTVWSFDEDDPDYNELIEEARFHNNKYPKELYPDTPYPDTPEELYPDTPDELV